MTDSSNVAEEAVVASEMDGARQPVATSDGRAAERQRASVISVYPIAVGGCGACAQSVTALHAPRYVPALESLNATFARSPRHADILLLSGPLTVEGEAAARAIIAATPQPHALIAIGDCAISGCVFATRTADMPSLADALDVNVEIAGCPPNPAAILAAIGDAAALLSEARAGALADTPPADDQGADAVPANGIEEEVAH